MNPLSSPRVPLDLELPSGAWDEPGTADLDSEDELTAFANDTIPAPPPATRPGLDLTILTTVERAVQNARRLTAAGVHSQARDDARMVFMLTGAELGLKPSILAALGDLLDRLAP